jgi:hypothetical protein
MQEERRESLEEEATHATDEARMVLPGVQAILEFQLVAVFNQRFSELSEGRQVVYLVAFMFLATAMGLIMTPAAYHRQAERGDASRTGIWSSTPKTEATNRKAFLTATSEGRFHGSQE